MGAGPPQRLRRQRPAWRGDEPPEPKRLKTSDKVHLAATYYRPKTRSGPAPAAILIHDAGQDRSQVRALAAYLQKRGFGVLTLDLRGHGKSTAEIRWDDMSDQERVTAWSLASRDLRAAAQYLRDQREIHSTNLSLIGVGAGCRLALRHAVDDENTRAVVLINPKAQIMGEDMGRAVGKLEGLPCLIVVPKDGRKVADQLRDAGREANDGLEFVEIQAMQSNAEKLLDDKRLNGSSVKWLRDHVMPSRKK